MKSAIRKNKYWDELKSSKKAKEEYFKQTGMKLGRILVPNKKFNDVFEAVIREEGI